LGKSPLLLAHLASGCAAMAGAVLAGTLASQEVEAGPSRSSGLMLVSVGGLVRDLG
jgi:hypothetical protein